jgi:magnesium chelatase subunit D
VIIGLRREREVLTVALEAGRHVVIEGPPGTGKSTLLRSIARDSGRDVIFVEGNAELTPARLIGQHDPSQVLTAGYTADTFADGPLLSAMRSGALLYLEEFNRVPEETLNVLITLLTEGEIAVPRLGTVRADPRFRLIAAMNPFDAIGTARVSQAIADRICRIVLGYQDARAEQAITTAVTGLRGRPVELAVALTRATREHRDVRMGSSVRGSIDLVLLLTGLQRLRGVGGAGGAGQGGAEGGGGGAGAGSLERGAARDAMHAALSGRIRVADGCDRTPESVLDEILDGLWPAGADGPALDTSMEDPLGPEADGRGKADGPPPGTSHERRAIPSQSRSSLRRDRSRGGARRSIGRAELALRHPSFPDVSPEAGRLDAEALAGLLAADPDGAAALLADLAIATDRELRAAARRAAARVFIRLGQAHAAPRARGARRLEPNHRGEGDLDLERTLDLWPGRGPLASENLVTRTWAARSRAVCLVVDASGSMAGPGVAMAAVAAAAVVLSAGDRLAPSVIAFSGDVRVLLRHGARRPPQELVGDLISLRGHGLTDLAGALRAAAAQLAGAGGGERVAVLLSDCLRTAGPDPAAALHGIDRLHVLCPEPGPGPAAALARAGGGICQPVTRLADVAPALAHLLS